MIKNLLRKLRMLLVDKDALEDSISRAVADYMVDLDHRGVLEIKKPFTTEAKLVSAGQVKIFYNEKSSAVVELLCDLGIPWTE